MKHINTGPEIWAGIECTINRIGDVYHQQLEKNGHLERLDDLERFAELGVKTIRYPVLWEQIAPGKLEDADWSWADERLHKLRALGICPIVGFVHHGSGPIHTSLTDPGFPVKLAAYAKEFAKRYPWIKYYTPVNEPLTTARFSGLYGHWYPHGRDNCIFAAALINQCKGVIMALQAIRESIPDAKLVQTEDLCKVYSTPLLDYQAVFENERRWLSLDLLCGKVNSEHAMWKELLSCHISEEALEWFSANACMPEIIGINHYVTSNRFLDENLDQYPAHFHGRNAFHQYADVEAIRIPGLDSCSLNALLREVWERYHLPIAVTEVHLGGHREEQLRWLKECWDSVQQLYADDIDVRAMTVWSLLGSFDWNSLVTRNENFYESGVFDIRCGTLRPTALSAFIRELISDQVFDMPILNKPGFWKRDDRFFSYHSHRRQPEMVLLETGIEVMEEPDAFPVLIIDAGNVLSAAFIACCRLRAIDYFTIPAYDADPDIREVMARYKPWGIINTSIYKDEDANNGLYMPELLNLAEISTENNSQLLAFIPVQKVSWSHQESVLNMVPGAMIGILDLSNPDTLHGLANHYIDLLIDKVSLGY